MYELKLLMKETKRLKRTFVPNYFKPSSEAVSARHKFQTIHTNSTGVPFIMAVICRTGISKRQPGT